MIRLLPVLLLAGCTAAPGPVATLHGGVVGLYELPLPAQRAFVQPVEPGRYRVVMDVLYTATREEATRRCNFGIPGGTDHACLFQHADPPLIVVPVALDQADWPAMCYLGHEVIHITNGEWHE